ncbi:MAG: ribosome biogenesis GTPase Der [Thermodesulfobacteriota bacterium]
MQHTCHLIALVGRPNVGKSSLFNRLTRTNKAIVDATPGVTRDNSYERVVVDDRMFMLVDTAGVEVETSDDMGRAVREHTMQAVDEADAILFLLDGRAGVTAQDQELALILRKTEKPVFCVVNKVDGADQEEKLLPAFYELGFPHLLPISASHGYGIDTLLGELVAETSLTAEAAERLPEDTISIACIGRPNVGKSSLVNRLLGQDRMVVSSVPGTTRDAVDTLLEHNGRSYLLTDTAGIRRRGKVQEKLEKFSVMRALTSMERCDITLLLIDAAEGITEQDTKVIGYALERGRACIILLNKWDLLKKEEKRQKQLVEEVKRAAAFIPYAPLLHISALTGHGIARILPLVDSIHRQYVSRFPTNRINTVLQKAVEAHPPSLYKGKRIRFYYATQVTASPPTFVVFANYPDGIHFSYHRYLVNLFREELKLDLVPIRILFRERQRKKYG